MDASCWKNSTFTSPWKSAGPKLTQFFSPQRFPFFYFGILKIHLSSFFVPGRITFLCLRKTHVPPPHENRNVVFVFCSCLYMFHQFAWMSFTSLPSSLTNRAVAALHIQVESPNNFTLGVSDTCCTRRPTAGVPKTGTAQDLKLGW